MSSIASASVLVDEGDDDDDAEIPAHLQGNMEYYTQVSSDAYEWRSGDSDAHDLSAQIALFQRLWVRGDDRLKAAIQTVTQHDGVLRLVAAYPSSHCLTCRRSTGSASPATRRSATA
jgi:hypothetical protein